MYYYIDNNIQLIGKNYQFDQQYNNIIQYAHEPIIVTPQHNVSVLIPTYNESDHIVHVLQSLQNHVYSENDGNDSSVWKSLVDTATDTLASITSLITNNNNTSRSINGHSASHTNIQYILCDGGSTDNTIELARQTIPNIIIHQLPLNTPSYYHTRAYLLNTAVRQHTNSCDILLFVHGDTLIGNNWLSHVINTLNQPGTILGSFKFDLHSSTNVPYSNELKSLVQFRSNLMSLPYGDQTLYLRKHTFEQLRGFQPHLQIMDDVDLVQRSKLYGIVDCDNTCVAYTSDRRYKQIGTINNILINQLCIVLYNIGIPSQFIKSLYTTTYRVMSDQRSLLQQLIDTVSYTTEQAVSNITAAAQ